MEFLDKLLVIFQRVNLPLIDPVLYGEVVMKYTLLLEADADVHGSLRKSLGGLSGIVYLSLYLCV